jgi:hypothetical protein
MAATNTHSGREVMSTTFIALDRVKTRVAIPIAALVVAALIVAAFAVSGWPSSSSSDAPTSPRSSTSSTPSGQLLECRLGRAC